MSTKELGDLGEGIACEYLVEKGFNILERNYRISFGEIDIIAKKPWKLFGNDKTIHFVEVKTVAGDSANFFPEERVDYKKRRKLKKLCLIWLEKHKFAQNHPYQIDIVGVLFHPSTGKKEVRYFPNVVEDR